MTERKVPEDAVTDLAAVDHDAPPHGPDASVYVVVSHAKEVPRVFDLPDGREISVGRTGENTVSIDDALVSRRHARIKRAGDVLSVEDLGSRNGTHVGARVLRGEASSAAFHDVVRVGPAEIVFAVVTPRAARAGSAGEDEPPLGADDIVIADREMRKVFSISRRLGASQTTVLILGETGVG